MEVFSPPRLVPVAVRQGLQASISLDKLCGWDANLPESKAHAVRLVREHAPWLLMLSPECTMFSILQRNCNTLRMDPLEVQMRTAEAEDHISFCMHLARVQAESGRRFCMEHPAGASSWKLPVVQDVLDNVPGAMRITFAQCRYGLRGPGGRLMRKYTSFLTNMPSVITEFRGKTCQCARNGEVHETIEGTVDGARVSRLAAIYPPAMVAALVACCRRELDDM
ncbi:unnamed protein product [Effrenium voratum]|nr:unnamed protein product [Effrenium voratum]